MPLRASRVARIRRQRLQCVEVNVTRPETRDHDSDKHVAKYSAISCTNTGETGAAPPPRPPAVRLELFNARSILPLFSAVQMHRRRRRRPLLLHLPGCTTIAFNSPSPPPALFVAIHCRVANDEGDLRDGCRNFPRDCYLSCHVRVSLSLSRGSAHAMPKATARKFARPDSSHERLRFVVFYYQFYLFHKFLRNRFIVQ